MPWIFFYLFCALMAVIGIGVQRKPVGFSVVFSVLASFYAVTLLFNGVDWLNYSYVYAHYSSEDLLTSYEPLFSIYLFVTRELIANFQISVLILYIISFCVMISGLKKLPEKVNIPMFIFVFLLASTPALINDQIRQFVAVSVSILAFSHLLNKRKLRFVLYGLLAASFHYSSIIILLAYPLSLMDRKSVFISGLVWIAIAVTFASSLPQLVSLLSSMPSVGPVIGGKIRAYISRFDISELKLGFGVVVDMIVFCGFFLFRGNGSLRTFWNLAFLSSCAHMTFYMFPIFNRFAIYLNVSLVFIVAAHTSIFFKKNTNSSLLSLAAVLAYSVIVNTQFFVDEMHPDLMDYEYHMPGLTDESEMLGRIREGKCADMEFNISNFCRSM